MKATESRAWKAAAWDYSALQADIQAPLFMEPLSQEQVVSRLRNMARRCPQFYPALLELGLRLLCRKRSRGAEQMIEKGFRLMLDLADPNQYEENMDAIIGNQARAVRRGPLLAALIGRYLSLFS